MRPVTLALICWFDLDLYTAMPYISLMLFIETSTFTKLLPKYLTDEEYRGLQTYLLQKPDAGDLIKGSGGVRKVRWAPVGSGKSASIPGYMLKQIAEAIKNE